MKPVISLYLLLLAFSGTQSQAITLAITDCNVITMKSNTVLRHRTILISGDKIVTVVPAAAWVNKDNVATIEGSGRYVMPALAEMHIHVNEYSNWVFDLLLAYGVTTIRVMAGSEAVLKWRDSVNRDVKIAPEIHVASELIDGNPPLWGDLHNGPVVTDADSVEYIIGNQMAKGYEFIKVYNRLEPAVYKKFRELCFARNIRLTGHIPIRLNKKDFLSAQTGEIEHLTGYAQLASNIDTIPAEAIARNSDLAYDLESAKNYSEDKISRAARLTKQYNIWNCPTLSVLETRADSAFCKQLPNTPLAQKLKPLLTWWTARNFSLTPEENNLRLFKRRMVKELYKNKALLLAGSDSPVPWAVPGLALHQELTYLVAAGLSNYDALKTATVNPALWFGKAYDKGTIESGKRADLLILSANPLEDIANTQKIVSVVFKGKMVKRE